MDLYSFLNEIIITLFKHGWSLTTWGILGALFFRLNSVRRMVLRRVPKRFRAEDRLDRVERKIDILLAQKEGQAWQEVGASKILTNGPTSLKRPSRLLQVGTFLGKQLRRKKNMLKKFKSRKFLMAVVGAILIVLNEGLDLNIPSDTVLAFAGLIATWIGAEAYVDGKRAAKSDDIYSDTDHSV